MSNAIIPLHAEEDGIYTPRQQRSRFQSAFAPIDTSASSTNQSRSGPVRDGGNQSANSSVRNSRAASAKAKSSVTDRDIVLTDSLVRSTRGSADSNSGKSFKPSTPPPMSAGSASATKVPPHASSAPRSLPSSSATVTAPPPPPRPVTQIPTVAVRSPVARTGSAGSGADARPSPLVYKKPDNPRDALAAKAEQDKAKEKEVPDLPPRSVSPQRPTQPPLLPFGRRSPSTSNRNSVSSDFITSSGVGRPLRPVGGTAPSSTVTVKARSPQSAVQLEAAVQAFNERLMNPRSTASRPGSSLSSTPRTQSRTSAGSSPMPQNNANSSRANVRPTAPAPLPSSFPASAPATQRSSGVSSSSTTSTSNSNNSAHSANSRGSGGSNSKPLIGSAVPRPPANTAVHTPPVNNNNNNGKSIAPTATTAPKTVSPPLPLLNKQPHVPLSRSASDGGAAMSAGSGSASASVNQQRRMTVPTVHTAHVPSQNGRAMASPYPNTSVSRPVTTGSTVPTANKNNSNGSNNNSNQGSVTPQRVSPSPQTTASPPSSAPTTKSAATTTTTAAATVRPTPPTTATPTPARPPVVVAGKKSPPAPPSSQKPSTPPQTTAPVRRFPIPTVTSTAPPATATTPAATPVRAAPTAAASATPVNRSTTSSTPAQARNGNAAVTTPTTAAATAATTTTTTTTTTTPSTTPRRVAPASTPTTTTTSPAKTSPPAPTPGKVTVPPIKTVVLPMKAAENNSANNGSVVKPTTSNTNRSNSNSNSNNNNNTVNGKRPGDDDLVATSVTTRRTNAIKPVSPRQGNDGAQKESTTPASPPNLATATAPPRGGRQRGSGTTPSSTPRPGPSLLQRQQFSDEFTDGTASSLESSVNRRTSQSFSNGGLKGDVAASRAEANGRHSPIPTVRESGSGMQLARPGRNTVADALLDSPTSGVALPSFGASNNNNNNNNSKGAGYEEDEEDDDDDDDAAPVSDGPKTPRAARRDSRRGRVRGASARRRSGEDKKHKKKPAVSSAEELATLAQYLEQEELNLSMSTFNSVQILAQSHALRVLNLNGSTLSSDGLRGLGNVPTLQSLCVSRMHRLRSLVPLITTDGNTRCALQEIDAQCTPLDTKGIQGLERLPRLTKLDLSMTSVTDVSVLSESRSLRELYLSVTHINNAGIAGLEKIPTLTVLNLSRSKVTSVVNIAKSHSIDTLILYSCKVDDAGLAGVQSMPRLATLDLSTTKVTDLSVLGTSTSLRCLKAQWLALKNCVDIIQERRQQMDRGAMESSRVLRDEQEAGYSGLAKIPTLETLDLSFNPIRSVSSLCSSKSLKRLILRRTRIDNKGIESIDKLSKTLEELAVTNINDGGDESEEDMSSQGSGATVGGVAAGVLSSVLNLAGLNFLSSLDLSFTDVFDLRMLQILKHLKELHIVETLVTVDGLRGIELIPTLEVLDVSQTSVMSLQFLVTGAKALRKIVVCSNRNVRGFRLGHLENLPRLEHLNMSDTVVEDVRLMWTSAWNLKELVWRWKERREATGLVTPLECWVTSERLTGLNKLPSLTMLDLTNSSVHNLQFIERSRTLKDVVLDGSRLLRDDCVASLATCKALETIDLSNIPHITDASSLGSCPKLRGVNLSNTSVTKKGTEELTRIPELKNLNIANTPAEEEMLQVMGEKAATMSRVNGVNMNNSFSYTRPQSRLMEESSLADVSMMDASATPAQFRVPRKRRVSFVAGDPPASK